MIKRLCKVIWFYKNIIPVIWKMVNGRWFVFRDSPESFVRMVSRLRVADIKDDDVSSLVNQAAQERKARAMSKRMRK